MGDEDEGDYYQHLARQNKKNQSKRNKKGKKGNSKEQELDMPAWDDVYDPTKPNVYAQYKGSEEQMRAARDWKLRLYHGQSKVSTKHGGRNGKEDSDDDEDVAWTRRSMAISLEAHRMTDSSIDMFAPPANPQFAPPTFDDDAPRSRAGDGGHDYNDYAADRRDSDMADLPVPASASVPNDLAEDDPYLRRMQMSGDHADQAAMPVTTPPAQPTVDDAAKKADAQIAAFKARLAKQQADKASQSPSVAPASIPSAGDVSAVNTEVPSPPQQPGAIISRPAVRYEVPAPPPSAPAEIKDTTAEFDSPSTEQSQPTQSKRKGYAERILQKMGWEKGQGLGASGEGITTALKVKAEKRKKLSDAEGGGWAVPANMGKIVGGKKRKIESDSPSQEAEVATSTVIKLEGMLNGLDVKQEIEEGNLMQEIGEEMGKSYGNVERVFIWREEVGGADDVFVKFTSELSALRAKNGMDGSEFADNVVAAKLWDGEKFEKGEYA